MKQTNEPKGIYSYNYNCSAMATTIQVSQETKQLLEELKKKDQTKTYDEVIQKLAQKQLRIPRSMFGATKKITPWKKEDRAVFREL